ncbi:histidine triad nucleotide-binding protein [bacterium]|nr:histidine triad nucleotide-binding protein [bacterium]
MAKECVFCQIVAKKLPAKIRYEDEEVIAFDDINPKAKIHILIVPKEHIASIAEAEEKHQTLLGKLLWVAKKLAEELKINRSGYKIVINTGKDGGQIIPHLHLHLLGGEKVRQTP